MVASSNHNKTAPSSVSVSVSVDEFIARVADERRREEAVILRELMERVSGEPATMWGPTMVGFGNHHYVYESGREGDTFVVGFSPRKAAISLYGLFSAYQAEGEPLLDRLGPHKTGKGCMWVKRLSDIDLAVLEQLVRRGVDREASGCQ